MKQISIRTKLFLTVLALAVPVLALVGGLAYFQGKSAVERTTFERLTSIRSGKASQIEAYFDQIRKQLRTLAQSRMVVTAVVEFEDAFDELATTGLSDPERHDVARFYRNVFLPRLASHSDSKIDPSSSRNRFPPPSSVRFNARTRKAAIWARVTDASGQNMVL